MAGVQCRTVSYVEIEAFAISNLVAQMEEGAISPAPIWTNLKTFDARPFRGHVDLITGGYPCQPFSVAGRQKGKHDPRHLWPYLQGIIDTARPIRCFFENVAGHLNVGFPEVYASLRDMGYRVEAGLYTSKEARGSHIRTRLFIMAELEQTDGRWSEKISEGDGFRVAGSGREVVELENANNRRDGISSQQFKTSTAKHAGTQLADTSNHNRRLSEQNKRQQNREVTRSSEELEHTIRNGSPKIRPESAAEESIQRSHRPLIAPPGPFQFPWEEPRRIRKSELKSRLGLPIDGYDYRTDFLRALGNGVDPWTAAIAWKELDQRINC